MKSGFCAGQAIRHVQSSPGVPVLAKVESCWLGAVSGNSWSRWVFNREAENSCFREAETLVRNYHPVQAVETVSLDSEGVERGGGSRGSFQPQAGDQSRALLPSGLTTHPFQHPLPPSCALRLRNPFSGNGGIKNASHSSQAPCWLMIYLHQLQRGSRVRGVWGQFRFFKEGQVAPLVARGWKEKQEGLVPLQTAPVSRNPSHFLDEEIAARPLSSGPQGRGGLRSRSLARSSQGH